MICGAFYPNYFASSDIDETDVMKVMSGHDPFTTVMVCSIVFMNIVAVEALSLVGRKLHLYRANDRRVSSSLKQFSSECQSNPELHWFCFNLLCDWSRKLAPLSGSLVTAFILVYGSQSKSTLFTTAIYLLLAKLYV